jgi:diguanylate cyclase (GGDEF)-like protein
LAYHDYLTSLNNKLALFEKASQCLPEKSDKHAIFFIDIFNFKYINDTLGHASGDKVIIKVSERLSSLIGEKCVLYRLDGDEFVIIQRIEQKSEAEKFAERILAKFKERFVIDRNNIINVYLSIGVAFCPEHGNSINELLKYADEAMYRAKKEGRNRYVFYDQEMHKDFTERLEIQKYLLTALEKNEFELYYQPQVDQSNQMRNIEALIRWNSPELGRVPPHKFIEIAEDSNEIIAIGKWVLNEACRFLKSLHLQGCKDLTVSVNISFQQLIQTDFVDMIIAAINQAGLELHHLELEITETILMESFLNISNRLKRLREHGVRIALDDFGKGYSSLGYLNQLPITTLKIDKLFVDDLASEKNRKITGQIVRLGKSMGLRVVAEGVKNQEQRDYLLEGECDYFQGEIFSAAVSGTEIAKMLNIVYKKH